MVMRWFAQLLYCIRDLAQKHAFTELHVEEITVRKEREANVPGYIIILAKPDPAANAIPA